MEWWVWLIIGPGGVLAVGLAAWKYKQMCDLVRHALDTKGPEGVDAVARAMHPWAEATKDAKVRRQRRKAEAAKQHPVVEVPRQAIAPSDDAEGAVRSGRTAG